MSGKMESLAARSVACLLTFTLCATAWAEQPLVIPQGPIAWHMGPYEEGEIVFHGDRRCFCSCGAPEPCSPTALFLGGLGDVEPIPIPGCDSCQVPAASILVTRLEEIVLPNVGSTASIAVESAPMQFGFSAPPIRACDLFPGHWAIRIRAVPGAGVMDIRRTQDNGGYFDLRFPVTFQYEWWERYSSNYQILRYSGTMGTLMVTAERIQWGQEVVEAGRSTCPRTLPYLHIGRAIFRARGTSENQVGCAYFNDGEVIYEGAPLCRAAGPTPVEAETFGNIKALFRF